MDSYSVAQALAGLPLGSLQFYPEVGSTNDEAVRLAQTGGPDLSLIVADEQTAGRGRFSRRWFTPQGSALAFSLVLFPHESWEHTRAKAAGMILPRLTALGALAVCEVLIERYHLAAKIKWPNDVLVGRQKLAGVLAEAIWDGERLEAVVLGVGLNVASRSLPPENELLFPATCLDDCLLAPVDEFERLALLRAILERILEWRVRISGVEFIQAWQEKLAFLDEWVWVIPVQAEDPQNAIKVHILGLEMDGSLRVEDERGIISQYISAEVHLRPLLADS